MRVTKVNTYALVFHWQGSNAELKPLLIAAHQGSHCSNRRNVLLNAC